MKHLKPIQILTPEAIYLLERVKMHLEAHYNVLPTEQTKDIITEFGELIDEIKK